MKKKIISEIILVRGEELSVVALSKDFASQKSYRYQKYLMV